MIAKLLDCGLEVSEFELQLSYYVYFQTNNLGKRIEPLPTLSKGLKVSRLFFNKDGLGIR